MAVPVGGGLPFQGTRYSLQITGGSLECGDVKSPQAGTVVSVYMNLKPDATGWIATADNGTLTLRFEPGSNTAGFGQIALVGTARGSADDQGLAPTPGIPLQLTGTRVTFDDASIPFSGLLPAALVPGFEDFGNGKFQGTVVFSRNGVIATCPAGAAGWLINRVR